MDETMCCVTGCPNATEMMLCPPDDPMGPSDPFCGAHGEDATEFGLWVEEEK